MKTFLQRMWALGAIVLVAFSLIGSPEAQARPGDRVSFQTFYDELEPYGRWINDPEYGYVWSPDVEWDFQPYGTRGHWVMTEYGNTWVSDYDWGWAPFHYGRWMYDDYYGWLWIPGSEWGPAWVNWRNGGGYYGWAPMGPRVTYVVAPVRWVFVPVMYITSPRIYSYCVPRTKVVNIYHNTTIINNYYERYNRKYVYGPRTQDIERATNRRVNVYRVDRDSRPGRTTLADNSVRIYRPDVNSRREEAPARAIARNSATNRSSLTDSNRGAVGRSDRSSNVDRSRVGNESGTYRSRTGLESSSEQRSVEREGVRTREGVRGATSENGEYSTPSRTRRADYPQRSSAEMNSTGTRTRRSDAAVQQRSSESPVPQRPEGSYSPRRAEAPYSQGQYQTRTRQEPSGQGQYQQRSRQEAAPVQRQAAPRQESSSGSEPTTRRSRN
ncbi:DUF6600 domain-containing protein [Rufibacter tibetensis]|uniref:Prolin-rich transmembrane protein n=1 Tax=Rufibacter tibetensis TaxID=512763 RepID=A0A0P0CDX6_9BACT|nr:DUF6600 domain-containing protein [Rufibacter tibetensis]ALJ00027.1 hypothetical protein DC20_14885 [Rufibacter tibetensis]